jgi:hypothetical protein
MLMRLRRRLAKARFVRKALERPVDPGLFKKKPSRKFVAGLSLMAVSYLLAWPLIALLGVIAWRIHRPAVFGVGSFVAYAVSNVVFYVGLWLAGKDDVRQARPAVLREAPRRGRARRTAA